MKENFFESFRAPQKESKERKFENLKSIEEIFLEKESEFFDKSEKKILEIKDPKERTSKFKKLKTLVLTTTIALGIVFGGLYKIKEKIEKDKETEIVELYLKKPPTEKIEREKIEEVYLKIKKIFEEKEKIEELEKKLKLLEKEYEENPDLEKYRNELEEMRLLIHVIENLIKKGERKEKIFSSRLGEYLYENAKKWIPLTKEEKLKIAKEHQVKIENFDQSLIPEINNEKIRQILLREDFLILSASVDEIKYIPIIPEKDLRGTCITKIVFSPERVSTLTTVVEIFGLEDTGMQLLLRGGEVRDYLKPLHLTLEDISSTLIHEIAHANDWRNSRILSTPEKIQFLYEATQIIKKNHNISKFIHATFSILDEATKKDIKTYTYEEFKKDEALQLLLSTMFGIKPEELDFKMIEYAKRYFEDKDRLAHFIFSPLDIRLKDFEELKKDKPQYLINLGFQVFKKEILLPSLTELKYKKVVEYWAEGLAMFLDPKRKNLLPKEHQKFFEKWYKKIIE
jgi:hypothetical protein